MASKNQINLIRSLATQRGLDPSAVLAVASQEGLSGGIGDQGTSFGPWQLHKGGALPSGISLKKAHKWAWSRPGLEYALDRMASVAGGLRGQQAVEAIVRRFERPAAPDREVAGALRMMGQNPSVGVPAGSEDSPPLGSTSVSAPLNSSSGVTNNPLLQAVLNSSDLIPVIQRLNATGGLAARSRPFQALPLRKEVQFPNRALPGILGQVAPAELLSEGTGGPTHSTGPHIHAAYTNPQAVLAAIRLAQSLGLSVGENPFVGGVDPVHVKNSYHYRTFPGLYKGRKLGQAIDVSGPNSQRFYSMLKRGL